MNIRKELDKVVEFLNNEKIDLEEIELTNEINRMFYKQGKILEWIFPCSFDKNSINNIVSKELKSFSNNKFASNFEIIKTKLNYEVSVKLNIDIRKLKAFGFEIKG